MQAVLHQWEAWNARRWTVAERMAALAAGLAAFAGLAVALLMTGLGVSAEHARHEGEAQRLARITAASLAPALEAGDRAGAAEQVRRMAAEGGAGRVELIGPRGEIWAAAGAGEGQGARAAIGAVGEVRVVPPPERDVAAAPLLAALALLAALVAAALPVVDQVVRRLLAPLVEIARFAGRVAAPNLGKRLESRAGGEIAALAEAVNQMLGRLDAAFRRARALALVDPVTDLPNQEHFHRRLAQTLAGLDPASRIGAALFVIAFDRVARTADQLGPDAAQELLARVGQRVSRAAERAGAAIAGEAEADAPVIAAHLGHGEFAVLAPAISTPAEVTRFTQQLAAALAPPLELREAKLPLGQVIGAALLPRDAADADGAIRAARLALGAARADGRVARVFCRSLDRAAVARAALERDLRAALDAREFRAWFQPKVDLASGRVVGCEALARWMRADGGAVSPGVFVPAAEEAGLIGELSEAVMLDACRAAAVWTAAGLEATVAVNVSALQLADERFPQRVLRMLDRTGLHPKWLELEITETVAIESFERALRLVAPLKAYGVGLALDDFGTGHSSIAAVSRLPFDTLKIDQRFVRGLQLDRHGPALVEAILAMAAALGYDTVAEGVETEAQAQFLRERGCGSGQGFLFGAALPAADYFDLLRAQAGEPLIPLTGFAA